MLPAKTENVIGAFSSWNKTDFMKGDSATRFSQLQWKPAL